MFRLLIIASLAISAQCVRYGGGGRSYGGGGYGGGRSYGGGGGSYGGGIVNLAVRSRHNVQYYDVPSSGSIQPITVEIGANPIPVTMIFRSASSNLNVQNQHEGQGGSFQESQSEDEPHILKHLVFKPVLQQIHEVITPRRLITQEIKPVFEDIQTLVARNSHGGNGGGFSQSNSLLGSMFGGGRRSGGGGGGGYSRGNSLYGSMSVSGGGYGRSSGRY